MFCMKCGQEISGNSAFCPNCGSALEQSVNQGNNGQEAPIESNVGQSYGGGYQARGYQQQGTNNAPAKTSLMVVGILLLIGGAVSIISCVTSLSIIKLAASLLGGGLVYFWWVVDLVYCFCILLGGIVCVLFSGKPDKADKVMLVGFAMIVLRILDWILAGALLSGYVSSFDVVSAIFGFIVPILVVLGGYKNKKAAQNSGYNNFS